MNSNLRHRRPDTRKADLDIGDYVTSEHLAWILDIQREYFREPMGAAIVQERMDARFPTSEHVMIWERLLVAIGAR